MKRSIFVLAALAVFARDPAPNPALDPGLRSIYIWTNADTRSGEVIQPGAILIVRKNGITTNPADAPFHAQNNYKDGNVKGSALNIFAQDQSTAGRLLAGDRVFVTKTEVKDASVVLSLLSVDTFHGLRVKASVAFQFPKGVLASADLPQVTQTIEELLALDNPPPVEPSQPAPPAAIELGATTDQVLAAAGEPEIIADLGAKLIYFYPNIKVIFLDGRVADVR